MNLKELIQEGVKVVELKNGKKFFVLKDRLISIGGWMPLSEYDEDLQTDLEHLAVCKIFDAPIVDGQTWNFMVNNYSNLNLIWERKDIILSETERAILQEVAKEFRYIAREKTGAILIFKDKPEKHKHTSYWDSESKWKNLDVFNHLFKFIQWEDDEPYSIDELLKGDK